MANYATLKAAIAAAIQQNGNKEITGNLLQQQLLAMVNSLGVGYQYAGIATPATNPGTPDQNVFYLASTAGTYTNFGGLVLADGEIAILKYNGAWSKDSTGAASLEKVNQLGQYIMPNTYGDITELANFVNGVAIMGQPTISYGATIRLVSNPIMATSLFDTKVTVKNNSSAPQLKIGVCVLKKSSGVFELIEDWNTAAEFSFDLSKQNAIYYVLNIAKTDESALTPADLNGIQILCDTVNNVLSEISKRKTEWVLFSDSIPNVDTSNDTLDLGANPILFIRPNVVINLSSVISQASNYRAISLVNSISSYSTIIFNLTNYTFSAVVRTRQLADDEIIIGTYDFNKKTACHFGFAFTIDGSNPYEIVNNADILNKNPIQSRAVRQADMEINAAVLSLRNGDITKALHFVNGVALNGWTSITYGTSTRLISDRIDSCSNGTITIKNNSSSPIIKIIVFHINNNGEYIVDAGWTTDDISIDLSSAKAFCIMLAKNDDSAISSADINGIEIINDNGIASASIFDFNPKNELIPKLLGEQRRTVDMGGSITQYPPVLSFIHFSDIHSDNDNLARIKQFYERYRNGYINFVIQTGDLIGGSFSDGMPTGYAKTTDFINVIGNHDSMNIVGTPPNHHWELVDQKSVYDLVIAPYVSGWGVTQPSDASEYGYCYFYKDFIQNKVRMVVIDCMHWDATQSAWFSATLEDARQNDLHIVVGTHYPPFLCEQDTEKNTFTSIQFDSDIAGTLSSSVANLIKDFITSGGKFVCWICGHIHQDISGFGRVVDGFDKQFMFSIATASVAPSVNYSEMGRMNGTKTQDCFNIVGIDTQSGLLKIVRIGADYDRYLRRRNTLCVDYINSRIVYCD